MTYLMPRLILFPFFCFRIRILLTFYAHSRHCSTDLKHIIIITLFLISVKYLYMFKKPLSVYTKLTVWLPISALLVFYKGARIEYVQKQFLQSNRKIYIHLASHSSSSQPGHGSLAR